MYIIFNVHIIYYIVFFDKNLYPNTVNSCLERITNLKLSFCDGDAKKLISIVNDTQKNFYAQAQAVLLKIRIRFYFDTEDGFAKAACRAKLPITNEETKKLFSSGIG